MTDPRLRDVALRAGVSMATASYVLRDSPGARISPSTRARVREAADEIGYLRRAPHRVCGGVVLVAPGPTERIAPGFVAAVTEAAWAMGLTTVLLPGDGATEAEAAVALREEGLRTVGIVRVADPDAERALEGAPSPSFAPTVLVDLAHRSPLRAEALVVPDDRQAARQVAGALRRAGHQRMAVVAADRRAHLAALWCAGFDDVVHERVPVLECDPVAGGCHAPTGALPPVDGHDRPTALVCLTEPTPACLEHLARQVGSAPDALTLVIRGGAGQEVLGDGARLRVTLPVHELARAALVALERSRGRSGREVPGRLVTRVRFPELACSPPHPSARGTCVHHASPVLLTGAGQ